LNVEDDLFARISRIIDETGVNPNFLGLEITESVVMNDVDYAVDVLTRLKALGVHLSVDDFGTGYSSLSYLKRFSIDLLKIDHLLQISWRSSMISRLSLQ
jgi:EAL domain-containing protein (putative c-di-GMP-specific phosphodiesterase class I)